MISETVKLNNKTGLHARPAAMLAKIMKKHDSSLTFVYDGKKIPIKGMMGILGAGIKGGSEVEIICIGEDEMPLMNELKAAFADGFGEG